LKEAAILFFQTMANSFKDTRENLWKWCKKRFFLIKPITCLWAILVSIIFRPISWFFKLGVVFDKIGLWLDNKRQKMIYCLKSSADSLSRSKRAYFLTPIKMMFCFPFAILLAIVPQLSGNVMIENEAAGEDLSFLRDTRQSYFKIAKNLLQNIAVHGILFLPIAFFIAIPATLIAILLGLIFLILRLLDPLGGFIGGLKDFTASRSKQLADNSGNHVFNAIFNPILLVLFAFPIATFLVLIAFLIQEKEN
jgi:hypothetical protein